MKRGLTLVTLVAGLAAAGSTAHGSTHLPKSCSPLLRLPPAAKAGQQTMYGHIKSLTRKGGRYEMRFDPALWLTGVAASRAALEDTGSSDVPNDYYIRDDTHRLLTFVVSASARVTVLPAGRSCTRKTTVAKLAQLVRKGTPLGFWIRIGEKYPGAVLSLDQQYQP